MRGVAAVFLIGCGAADLASDAGIPCADGGKCALGWECQGGVCERLQGIAPGEACLGDEECSTGACVQSTCAAPCAREQDCESVATLACRWVVERDGADIPREVATWCLPANDERVAVGESCASLQECRSGLCHLGSCARVCEQDPDCPGRTICAEVAAYGGGFHVFSDECPEQFAQAARTRLCLPVEAASAFAIGEVEDGQAVVLDIPAHAASFMLLAETENPVYVGFDSLWGPGDAALYTRAFTFEELRKRPLWYYANTNISTMLVPNTPDLPYEPGPYCAVVLSADQDVVPAISANLKLSADGDVRTGALDLNFYLMNLSGLGCGVDGLDAKTAAEHPVMSYALDGTLEILASAHIAVGEVRFFDRLDHPELDSVAARDPDQLDALFSLATSSKGRSVDVFFVRTLTDGPLGVAGHIPGPPGRHGIPHAAVAVSMDSSCALNIGSVTAHEIGHLLGLFHSYELDGGGDNIADTNMGPSNLMTPNGYGWQLTEGQGFVMRRHGNVR